jgi:hypothetical protein
MNPRKSLFRGDPSGKALGLSRAVLFAALAAPDLKAAPKANEINVIPTITDIGLVKDDHRALYGACDPRSSGIRQAPARARSSI